MENSNNLKDIEKKLVVEYKNNWYDLTNFIRNHPGGENILKFKNGKSINIDFDNSKHSVAAKYLLNQYELGAELKSDEGMEHLVDWNKPMLAQISNLGENYNKWVNLPIDRPLRFAEKNFLESLTKSAWYIPLLFWIPIIISCILNEAANFETTFEMCSTIFIQLMIGVCSWTLIEYCIHRHIFHIDVRRFPSLKTFHFLFHGSHHKVPFDKNRLVFPPIPAAVAAIFFYQFMRLFHLCNLICYPKLIMAGILIGFLCYDMIHYYIHFGNPSSNYFYNLKRHHNDHHFVNYDKGFGVSSPFWDCIFGTKVLQNKLNYRIKWQ